MDILQIALRAFLAAFGIGLVIFVHEWGHFIAARICGVRVEVFSIGFGRKLFGWKRGTTSYQLAVVPLGGYVRMAGEDRSEHDQGPPDEDSLGAKTVGQRFFIYSGGVLMNLLFGMIVFPILFAVGVPFERPTLGESVVGGVAWRAGLAAGTEVKRVDGDEVFDFLHVLTSVALSDPEGVELEVLEPGATTTHKVVLKPEPSSSGLPDIGIRPNFHPDGLIRVVPDSAADHAGLRNGDSYLGVVGGLPGLSPFRQFRVATRDGGPVTVRVRNETGERTVELVPNMRDSGRRLLGIMPRTNHIAALRPSAAADRIGLLKDDRLIEVAGKPIEELGDLHAALVAARGPLEFLVERGGRRVELSSAPLTQDEAVALAESLAVAPDVASTVMLVEPDGAAYAAGLRSGDRILRVDGEAVEDFGDITGYVGEAARQERAVVLSIERRPADPSALAAVLEIEAAPAPRLSPDYGFDVELDTYVYRAGTPLESIEVGLVCSWKMVEDTWLTFKRMLLGQVSTEHLGGIVTIGAVSYTWVEEGLAKLFYFLCMLSINLAFLNVLPIPVLDGGHLFFLLIEKVKGSPVSDRVLAYSQMIGLVVILSLMVYVTFNDIQRWFF